VLSRNLEKSLHRALAYANERRHEYATLEHLLLALTQDQDAVAVFHACGVELDRLRRELLNYVDNELGNLVFDRGDDANPTASFQRVLQRAAIHVQSTGREEVTGANVLVAMFAERESQAVYYLQEQDMTRFDAVNYITHGIAKAPGRSETRRDHEKAERTEGVPNTRETPAVNEDGTTEVLGPVAYIRSRERAGDHVEVTLRGVDHGRRSEIIGTYLLADDHVDFEQLYQALATSALTDSAVQLTIDPDSNLIRSVVFGRSVFARSTYVSRNQG
jgi:ATP-dependent Clp protease ATP-binding subunit ClpA